MAAELGNLIWGQLHGRSGPGWLGGSFRCLQRSCSCWALCHCRVQVPPHLATGRYFTSGCTHWGRFCLISCTSMANIDICCLAAKCCMFWRMLFVEICLMLSDSSAVLCPHQIMSAGLHQLYCTVGAKGIWGLTSNFLCTVPSVAYAPACVWHTCLPS